MSETIIVVCAYINIVLMIAVTIGVFWAILSGREPREKTKKENPKK